MINSDQIRQRMFKEMFDARVMVNSFRGYWCEYMILEALGEECTAMPGWYPWDLCIGEQSLEFPDRIRIQVKNTATLQEWHNGSSQPSKCQWALLYRKKAPAWDRDFPGIPCEETGFMCELFILCLHEHSGETADQRDPLQWKFYMLPVHGPNNAVTTAEIEYAQKHLDQGSTRATTTRAPKTL